MRMFRPALVFTSLLLLVITLCACSTEAPAITPGIPPQPRSPVAAASAEPSVRVIATRNFGTDLMFDKVVELSPETSAMEALKEVSDVETSYGAGFVNAINGVRSGFTGDRKAKADWFIYINGIQSNIGALDYKLQPGDIEQWDFHDWGFRQFIPASIGAFPEPFLHGYGGKKRPTIIVTSDNLREPAQKLGNRLVELGVKDVRLSSNSELSGPDREDSNLILIDTVESELISEMNQNWEKLGFFTRFDNGNLVVLDTVGETAATYSTDTGLIQAAQNPWNPNGIGACENVAWMVTGTDESGVKNALEILLEDNSQLQYAFAAVITNGEIIRVP